MGVIFASPGKKDRIVGATLNYEIDDLEDDAYIIITPGCADQDDHECMSHSHDCIHPT